jgi:hypothetical protein
MIKFFRRIRQNLLMENKTGKYFKYAIGEIILVVIGILIALQINNWNEGNKQQLRTENLILRLEKQISQNIEQAQKRKENIKSLVEQMTSLMLIIGKPLKTFDQTKLDNILDRSILDHRLGLDLNTLAEAQDNGEIATIKNDSLRIALYKLSTLYKNIEQRQTIANADNLNYMQPYFYENINGRNIASNVNKNYKEKIGYSELKNHSYAEILSDREFENMLDVRIYYAQEIAEYYEELEEHLEYTKELLDKEK